MQNEGHLINKDGSDSKVRTDVELKDTLSDKGFSFNYTEDNNPKNDLTISKKMNINEFLNEQ